MQIVIDLDETICSEEKTYSRSIARINKGAKECIAKWYEEGHTIIIYSARTWMEYEMTVHWLKKNKIRYHQLVMGKPVGDVWIDDRAIPFKSWKAVSTELEKKRKR